MYGQHIRQLKKEAPAPDTTIGEPSPSLQVQRADTVIIYPYDSAIVNTDNGSMCICAIQNKGKSQQPATIAAAGAPKSVTFENGVSFNGLHIIEHNDQLVAVANFAGAQLNILNLTIDPKVGLVVVISCMANE
jgi:hypothetical protein